MTAGMHALSLYLDTSVIGGYFDPEFMADTRALWRLRDEGRFRFISSVVLDQEIARAPEQVRELMRTTFGGLGLALGLAVMVVFMIMASQFKSLRLPFVMLFTIPVSLVGIVLALMAAGQGFSITALMGILMVIGIAVSAAGVFQLCKTA